MIQFMQVMLTVVTIYIVAGILFSIPFYMKGMDRIDENAKGSTWGFMLIVLPGIIVFWPFLLIKWMKRPSTK